MEESRQITRRNRRFMRNVDPFTTRNNPTDWPPTTPPRTTAAGGTAPTATPTPWETTTPGLVKHRPFSDQRPSQNIRMAVNTDTNSVDDGQVSLTGRPYTLGHARDPSGNTNTTESRDIDSKAKVGGHRTSYRSWGKWTTNSEFRYSAGGRNWAGESLTRVATWRTCEKQAKLSGRLCIVSDLEL